MVHGIDDQSFDKITQEFLTAAKRDHLPDHLSEVVVELHRGPVSGTDALVTWKRWLEAPPDDPIGDLTPRDIRDLFQRSVQDLGRSQKAMDGLSKRVTDPSNLPTFAEASRKSNWQAFRSVIADGIRTGSSPRESLLATLDTPLRLAQHGLLQDLFVETFRRSVDAFTEQTALLEELSRGGLAGLVGASGSARGSKGLPGAIMWHVGGTAFAGGVGIASGLLGLPIAAGGCGIAAAGYCLYCLSRYRRVDFDG
jgi:hypothetical protein